MTLIQTLKQASAKISPYWTTDQTVTITLTIGDLLRMMQIIERALAVIRSLDLGDVIEPHWYEAEELRRILRDA